MEIITPGIGPFVWTIINLIAIGLIIYAIYHLIKTEQISSKRKFLWILLIIFLHLIGALIYFAFQKKTTIHSAEL